jgi:hypothetical protein
VRASARPLYHRILGPLPVDPTRGWRGNGVENASALRIVYYGDCAFRAMDRAHALDSQVGWPTFLSERLRARGTASEWSVVFVPDYETLPPAESLRRYVYVPGDPHVVIVHTGGIYGRRVILPDTPLMLRLRDDIGRRLGRHVFAGYRMLRPIIRLAGRPVTPYQDAADLQRFLLDVRAAWPDAAIVVIGPFRRLIAGAAQRRIEARVIADTRAAAHAGGVDFMDLSRILRGRQDLRCANGYNLSVAGSRVVADELLGWLDARAPVRS